MAKVSSPTKTEWCIESLIAVFQKHAGRDGNNSKLSKAEFLIFMNTELGAFTKNQKDPGVLDRMMKRLDLNSDGQLEFQEFLNLIGGLAIACHESFIKSASCQKWIGGTFGLSLQTHSLSFQPLSYLLFTAPTYPEPSTPTYPGRPLLLVIKQYCFLKQTNKKENILFSLEWLTIPKIVFVSPLLFFF